MVKIKISFWAILGVFRKVKKARKKNSPKGKRIALVEVIEIAQEVLEMFGLKVEYDINNNKASMAAEWK